MLSDQTFEFSTFSLGFWCKACFVIHFAISNSTNTTEGSNNKNNNEAWVSSIFTVAFITFTCWFFTVISFAWFSIGIFSISIGFFLSSFAVLGFWVTINLFFSSIFEIE